MRLLETLPNGDFHLTQKSLDNVIPPYAILSHTWGDVSQEVIFEDMVQGSGKTKQDIKRSDSVANKPLGMVYSTSGWTAVAL